MTHSPTHIEFRLDFVISSSQVQQPRADRRLNAIENTLVALARQWRPDRPVVLAEELRLAPTTLMQLRAWVEEEEAATGRVAERLSNYPAAIEVGVPDGWVRLILASPLERVAALPSPR